MKVEPYCTLCFKLLLLSRNNMGNCWPFRRPIPQYKECRIFAINSLNTLTDSLNFFAHAS